MILSSPARVVIVENQPSIQKAIELLVNQQPGFKVIASYTSVQDAIQLIETELPDIVLLDIQLPDGTGVDKLDNIHNVSMKIVFLTAHKGYAIQAVKVAAIDYLLKPLNPLELKETLKSALQMPPVSNKHYKLDFECNRNNEIQHRIVLRSYDCLQVVDLNEILYCCSTNGYTTFHLINGKKVIMSKHLKEYEILLPESRFLRPHQSYIVNHHFIEFYQKKYDVLILKNGTEIPVSYRRRDIVNDYFNTIT